MASTPARQTTLTGRLIPLRPHEETRTRLDTVGVSSKVFATWLSPPFQRPLKVNKKVEDLAVKIHQDGGVIPGTITLGIVDGKTYILDGQHRKKSFELAGDDEFVAKCVELGLLEVGARPISEGYCDVRIHYLDSMAEAGQEFVALNSALVRFSPDDILRGLEGSTPALQILRKACSFVGYDNIRRSSQSGAVVSVSLIVRAWSASGDETPGLDSSAPNIIASGRFDENAAREVVGFLNLAFEAWGRELLVSKLWGAVNLSICMWLYRRLVRNYGRTSISRMTQFTVQRFKQCLMALAADPIYCDWLVGRHSPPRDRSAAYGSHIKRIFQTRYFAEEKKKPILPAPEWST